jgi:hypothetical protein
LTLIVFLSSADAEEQGVYITQIWNGGFLEYMCRLKISDALMLHSISTTFETIKVDNFN